MIIKLGQSKDPQLSEREKKRDKDHNQKARAPIDRTTVPHSVNIGKSTHLSFMTVVIRYQLWWYYRHLPREARRGNLCHLIFLGIKTKTIQKNRKEEWKGPKQAYMTKYKRLVLATTIKPAEPSMQGQTEDCTKRPSSWGQWGSMHPTRM